MILACLAVVLASALVFRSGVLDGDPQPDARVVGLDLALGPGTVRFDLTDAVPGVDADAVFELANSGTLGLRYALSRVASNADGRQLATQIVLVIRTEGSGCQEFDGSTIYDGPLVDAAFGNRELAAGAAETLCARASLPLATDNRYQGASTTVAFTFTAEALP